MKRILKDTTAPSLPAGLIHRTSLDSVDQQIVLRLQADGRAPTDALAESLGVDATTIQRRIRRLVDGGIMRVAALVNPEKVGLPVAVTLMLSVSPERLSGVLDALEKVPAIRFLASTTGRYDVLAFSLFPSNEALARFIDGELARLEGVHGLETFISLQVLKGNYDQYRPVEDSFEGRLISLLQKDGRQSARALARKLGADPSTVARRLNRLTGEGAIRIGAVVDLALVGLPVVAVAGFDIAPGQLRSAGELLARWPYPQFASTASGRFSLLSFMRFASNDELARFLERQLPELPGVRASETSLCLNVRKGRYTQI